MQFPIDRILTGPILGPVQAKVVSLLENVPVQRRSTYKDAEVWHQSIIGS